MLMVNNGSVFKEDLPAEVDKAFDKIMEERKKGSMLTRIMIVIRGNIGKDHKPFCDVFID